MAPGSELESRSSRQIHLDCGENAVARDLLLSNFWILSSREISEIRYRGRPVKYVLIHNLVNVGTLHD